MNKRAHPSRQRRRGATAGRGAESRRMGSRESAAPAPSFLCGMGKLLHRNARRGEGFRPSSAVKRIDGLASGPDSFLAYKVAARI